MLTALVVAMSLGAPYAGGAPNPVVLRLPASVPGAYSSPVASDGSGLSFARASNATFLNSAGYLETASSGELRVQSDGVVTTAGVTNLMLYSEQANNTAVWVTENGVIAAPTVTANSASCGTSPDGTSNTGEKVDLPAYDGVSAVAYSLLEQRIGATNASYSGSVYLKKVSGDNSVRLRFRRTSDGTAFYTDCAISTSGYTRCSLDNKTLSAALWALEIGPTGGDAVHPATGATSVCVWGWQAETGSAATTYIATTRSPGTTQVTGSLGYFIEDAATNLLKRSAEIDNAGQWGTSGPVGGNVTSDPSGGSGGDMLTSTSGAGSDGASNLIGLLTAAKYTFSFYVKATATTSSVEAGILEDTAGMVPASGAVLSGPGALTTSTSGNTIKVSGLSTTAWTRIAVSMTANANTAHNHYVFVYPKEVSPQGAGQSVYLWGAQFELGSSATSYIATAGTSAARVADALSVPNPLTTGSDYCIRATVTPGSGRNWNTTPPTAGATVFANIGSGYNAANTATLVSDNNGYIYMWTRDGSAARYVARQHGFAAGSTHVITGCVDSAGAHSIYFDGVKQTPTLTDSTGSGIITMPSTLYVGYSGSTYYANANIANVGVSRVADPARGF